MEPLRHGPKTTKTITGDFLGGKEHASENPVGRHIPLGKGRQKPSQGASPGWLGGGRSAHGIKSARAEVSETWEGYPATGTEGEVPRAEFSRTGAKINCNNGQERKAGTKRGSWLLRR